MDYSKILFYSIIIGMLFWMGYVITWYFTIYDLPTDSSKNQQIIEKSMGNSHKCDSHNCEADKSTLCGTNVDYFVWSNGTGYTRSVGFYPETCSF